MLVSILIGVTTGAWRWGSGDGVGRMGVTTGAAGCLGTEVPTYDGILSTGVDSGIGFEAGTLGTNGVGWGWALGAAGLGWGLGAMGRGCGRDLGAEGRVWGLGLGAMGLGCCLGLGAAGLGLAAGCWGWDIGCRGDAAWEELVSFLEVLAPPIPRFPPPLFDEADNSYKPSFRL